MSVKGFESFFKGIWNPLRDGAKSLTHLEPESILGVGAARGVKSNLGSWWDRVAPTRGANQTAEAFKAEMEAYRGAQKDSLKAAGESAWDWISGGDIAKGMAGASPSEQLGARLPVAAGRMVGAGLGLTAVGAGVDLLNPFGDFLSIDD